MTTIQQQSTSLCDTKYKIVFLGDMSVGKTSIIQRFVKDQFDLYNNPTVGIDFLTRNICFQSKFKLKFRDKTYRLQLWDTAGQQKYKSLVPAYLRDAHCAVFVFDYTRPETFENLQNWIQIYRDHCNQLAVGFILGNKSDLINNEGCNSQNTQNKNDIQLYAQEYAKKQNMMFRKVSAKTGKGVLQTFQNIILELRKDTIDQSLEIEDDDTKLEKQVLEKFSKLKLNSQQRNSSIACCYI